MTRPSSQSSARVFFNKDNYFIWLLIVAHLLITLPLAWKLNLWLDEAWSLKTTANLATVWNEAIFSELQAPIYFLLLAVWRTFNDSVFFARLFSIICTVAAIFVFDKLARRILPETLGKFATAFFAVHPYLIFVALEVRLYALAVLISALLMFFWHSGYAVEENKRARIRYAVVSILGLYTYYYLGFLLVANAVALLILRRWQALKSYLLQMAIVAVGIVPLIFIIRQQFSTDSNYARVAPSVVEGVRVLWHHFLNFILPADWQAMAVVRLWLARLALLILLFLLVKTKARILSKTTVSLGTIVAVFSAFFFVADAPRIGDAVQTNLNAANLRKLQSGLFDGFTETQCVGFTELFRAGFGERSVRNFIFHAHRN
jgi:uncharacterized membrane protein